MRKGVQKIYSEVVDNYERINHILTFGLDRFWRKKTSRIASQMGGDLWLDVCSGTGELAHQLSLRAGKHTKIVAVDFSYPMLARAAEKKPVRNLFFSIAEAGALPFYDNTFDLVTISFAARNLNPRRDIMVFYLREFCRVLKSGGHFVNLETSQPPAKFLRKIFHCYVKRTVRPVGKALSGSESGYRYLSFTIPRFYDAAEFSKILKLSGFSSVRYKPLFFGAAAVHIAEK